MRWQWPTSISDDRVLLRLFGWWLIVFDIFEPCRFNVGLDRRKGIWERFIGALG
jgi:hypothetical protein